MKKLVILLVVLVMMAGVAWADELKFGGTPTFTITESKDFEGILVVSKSLILRIYDNGTIKKEIWAEINGNEEVGITTGTFLYPGSTSAIWGTSVLVSEEKKEAKPIIRKSLGNYILDWNEDKSYLEITSEKIWIRVYECGMVKQHEWKNITSRKEKP